MPKTNSEVKQECILIGLDGSFGIVQLVASVLDDKQFKKINCDDGNVLERQYISVDGKFVVFKQVKVK